MAYPPLSSYLRTIDEALAEAAKYRKVLDEAKWRTQPVYECMKTAVTLAAVVEGRSGTMDQELATKWMLKHHHQEIATENWKAMALLYQERYEALLAEMADSEDQRDDEERERLDTAYRDEP